MRISNFKSKISNRDLMAGTFLKTPAYELVEILADTNLDFICIDMEHSPFDRARADMCLAIARAKDFPVLVRVTHFSPETVLQALDMGAVGIVAPHIATPQAAKELAQSARYGKGGRGFAGATRWANYGAQTMAETLQQAQDETVVFAQIEEMEALDHLDEIAATDGIDGLFLGPADMSVSLGKTDTTSAELRDALAKTGAAAKKSGIAYMTFVNTAEQASDWATLGAHMFFVGSEQNWIQSGANSVAKGIHAIKT